MHCRIPVPSHLAAGLPAGESPRWCIASDLDADGAFGRSYLILGERTIVLGDAAGVRGRLSIDAADSFILDELPNRVRILARRADGDRVLIAGSPELAQELGAVCRALGAARQGQPPLLPEHIPPARDPATGVPLRERGQLNPPGGPFATLGKLLGLLGPHRRRVGLLIALTFVSVGAQLVPPLIFKAITDDVIGAGRRDLLPWLIAGMAGTFVIVSLARLAANRQNLFLSLTVVGELRARIHAKMQRLRMSYHNQHESGELIGRVSHDTGQLQHFLVDGLPWMLVNTVSLLVIGGVLFSLDPVLALAVLLPVPVFIIGSAWFHRGMEGWWHRMGNRVARMHSLLGESIRGVRAVKAAGQEDRRARAFDAINGQLVAANLGGERTWILFMESATLAMAGGTVLVWGLGAARIGEAGGPSLGTLIAFVGYMAMFYGPLQWFAFAINWFARCMSGAERVFAVLDQPDEAGDDRGEPYAPAPGAAVAIAVEDLHFSYERGRAVLKGTSFQVAAGSMVGLVGRSGSGKSTIISLLCRFHVPESGRILIDGRDLAGLRLSDWRRHVGLVPQEPFLFNASILDNIRYARPEADLDAVVRAAKAAHAHEFIMKKADGYDAIVGEGGIALSGGEKQRIAIARAILQDPPLLILDEATSAVDSETEALIQEAIERLVRGRTTIAIAHRLATLRRADRLIVIDEGRIAEQGTHAELLARPDGIFAKLARTQQELIAVMSLSGPPPAAPAHLAGEDGPGARHPPLVRHGDRLAWTEGGTARPISLAWYRPRFGRGSDLGIFDEKGRELARVASPCLLPEDTARLVDGELRIRYGDPVIEAIRSARLDSGKRILDLATDRGPRTIMLWAVERNVAWQADGSALITDVAGNRFVLPRREALDQASWRRLEAVL